MINRSSAPLSLLLFVLSAVFALPAHAQNIVNNGDFEQAPTVSISYGSDPSSSGAVFDPYWVIQNNVGIDSACKYVFAGSNSLPLTSDNS